MVLGVGLLRVQLRAAAVAEVQLFSISAPLCRRLADAEPASLLEGSLIEAVRSSSIRMSGRVFGFIADICYMCLFIFFRKGIFFFFFFL